MSAAAYEALMKWSGSSEAKQRADAAKAHAIAVFKKRFPFADMSRFEKEVEFDLKRKATASVLFTERDGSQTDVLRKNPKYWSQPLKDALGFHQDGGFPAQISLRVQNTPQPVPAVDFSEKTPQSVADLFKKEMKIYVTPTEFFTTKFRNIFTKPFITWRSGHDARKWLAKPDMSFWPQQLNFAMWSATTGCGVSREMLFPSSLNRNKFARSISSTFIILREKYCMKWVGFRVRALYLTIQPFSTYKIPMMLPLTKEYVANLASTQPQISDTHMDKITDSGIYT